MNDEMKAFEKELKDDKKAALKLAKAYVKDHRDEFAVLESLSLETVVALVSEYRRVGKTEECLRADMWAQAEFGPQQVTGAIGIGE